MKKSRTVLWVVLGFALFVLGAQWGSADAIILKDGQHLTGVVTTQDAFYIYVDVMASGIRGTLPIKIADVVSIIKAPLPAGYATSRPAPQPNAAASAKLPEFAETAPVEPPAAEAGEYYIEVPLKGVFGDQIKHEGVQDAIEYAVKTSRVKHIVFTLDSRGGSVSAASRIIEIMAANNDSVQYHLVAREATHVSAWMAFASDTVHMVDGGTIGRAVAYRQTSGNVEIDDKLNAVWANRVRAIAFKKGYSPLLVDAMMLESASMYAWRDRHGQAQIGTVIPNGKKANENTILFSDDEKTVLMLTRDMAVAVGLAQPLNASIEKDAAEKLGTALGLANWKKFNSYGEFAMRKANVTLRTSSADRIIKEQKLETRACELLNTYWSNIQEARQYRPNFSKNGKSKFTREERGALAQKAERSLNAFSRVLVAIKELKSIDAELVKMGWPSIIITFNLKETGDRISRDIQDLKDERARAGL